MSRSAGRGISVMLLLDASSTVTLQRQAQAASIHVYGK